MTTEVRDSPQTEPWQGVYDEHNPALRPSHPSEGANRMADNSLNANDFAQRITATPAFGMNALKPIMHFQVSMLRMWADSIERLAGNYKKGFEETARTVEEQSDKDRAA
jgi:hypothetical protein